MAVAQVDGVVQSTSAQAEELTATATELSSQAEQLREMVSRFRLTSTKREAQSAIEELDALAAADLDLRPPVIQKPKPRKGKLAPRRAEPPIQIRGQVVPQRRGESVSHRRRESVPARGGESILPVRIESIPANPSRWSADWSKQSLLPAPADKRRSTRDHEG